MIREITLNCVHFHTQMIAESPGSPIIHNNYSCNILSMTEITLEIDGKKPYIISFKKKSERKDTEHDKTQILQDCVTSSHLEFVDVGMQELSFLPQDNPKGNLAFDINDYTNPMVSTYLTSDDVDKLNREPNIASVEEDGIVYHQSFNEMAAIENIGLEKAALSVQGPSAQAFIPWGINRVKAPQAWDATKGKGIYVAVLDTGIWPHNDLQGNLIGGISFVPGQNWTDGNGHGTHVAGTIGANSSGKIVGVAPSVHLYAIKVLNNSGWGQWSWLIAGLYWMRRYHGCTFDVANLSLGGPSAPSALQTYCTYAAEQTLLVAAAGNEGQPVGVPAKYPECIAVSAIDSNDSIAAFSNRGPEVELCAPGVGILSTLPGNSYGNLNGTSMAAPHVAGAAALCRATHRGSDMNQIRTLLKKHADDLGHPGKDDLFGYGRVDCNGSTYDRTCG